MTASAVHANSFPQAVPDRHIIRAGESLVVAAPGVLENDVDADGDTLSVEPVDDVASGQLLLFPDGSFSYTPDSRFQGGDRFTYRACDEVSCSAVVEVRIESDGIPEPLAARPDRFVIVAGMPHLDLAVMDNDVFAETRIQGGRLDIVSPPSRGTLEVLVSDPVRTSLRYRPRAAEVGIDRFRYRLCESSTRCAEAEVEVRILPFAPVVLDVSAASGFRDVPFRALPEMPAPALSITPLARPRTLSFPLAVDPTPVEPWAGGGIGSTLFTIDGGDQGRDVRIRVDLSAEDADVDLYVGVDDDTSRRASRDELDCASASAGGVESCEFELSVPAGQRLSWWALAHNRESRRLTARLSVLEVDIGEASPLVWSGPGRVEEGAGGAFRLSWTNLAFAQGSAANGWIRLEGESGVTLGWVPLRLTGERPVVAPRLLRDGDTARFDLPAGVDADRLVLDVPEGANAFSVSAEAGKGGVFSLELFRVAPTVPVTVAPFLQALPADAMPEVVARSDEGAAEVGVAGDVAGRWMLRVRGTDVALPEVSISPRITLAETFTPRLRPGFFVPQGRPGEGLFLDRSGGDWVGYWHAFDDAGASTWLFLQGPEPSPGGAWMPTVYRSSVGRDGQRLADVGRASLAILDDGPAVFTFELDGRAGSLRVVDQGRGCPDHLGEPRDLSGIWRDPDVTGDAHGLWFTPAYEFQVLYVHDARGQPRHLVAEGEGFSTVGDRVLDVSAYRGPCVLCAPVRPEMSDAGFLHRQFAPALTPLLVNIEALLGPGVVGSVVRRSSLERLDADAGGFGCPGKR